MDVDYNEIYTLTENKQTGFITKVPQLEPGETIHFHYLAALNDRKPSIDYPHEEDYSSWFAVDLGKDFLHKHIENNFIGFAFE